MAAVGASPCSLARASGGGGRAKARSLRRGSHATPRTNLRSGRRGALIGYNAYDVKVRSRASCQCLAPLCDWGVPTGISNFVILLRTSDDDVDVISEASAGVPGCSAPDPLLIPGGRRAHAARRCGGRPAHPLAACRPPRCFFGGGAASSALALLRCACSVLLFLESRTGATHFLATWLRLASASSQLAARRSALSA